MPEDSSLCGMPCGASRCCVLWERGGRWPANGSLRQAFRSNAVALGDRSIVLRALWHDDIPANSARSNVQSGRREVVGWRQACFGAVALPKPAAQMGWQLRCAAGVCGCPGMIVLNWATAPGRQPPVSRSARTTAYCRPAPSLSGDCLVRRAARGGQQKHNQKTMLGFCDSAWVCTGGSSMDQGWGERQHKL